MLKFTPKGNVIMEPLQDGLRFTVTTSQPHDFGYKGVSVRSAIEAEGLYRLPLKIDLTVSLETPGFCILLGKHGRIPLCTDWDTGRRVTDLAEPDGKIILPFANHFPLNTPTDITVIYNLKSMQILINGEQRYYSTKEKYMKSALFPELNAGGFNLRLTGNKRTNVLLHSITVTESGNDFEITKQEYMPDPITSNIPVPAGVKASYENIIATLGRKPTFEDIIAGLPADIHAKVVEIDAFLRSYKPLKFRRTLEKYGNKISYVASGEGFSYHIRPSRDLLTHDFCWYMLTNSRENWGKRKGDRLVETLEKLAADDPAFANRIFSYTKDCVGCYPHCVCLSPYTFGGKKRFACHGKFDFKGIASEFDDVMRFVRAIVE